MSGLHWRCAAATVQTRGVCVSVSLGGKVLPSHCSHIPCHSYVKFPSTRLGGHVEWNKRIFEKLRHCPEGILTRVVRVTDPNLMLILTRIHSGH
jgi:hypothetical protein